MAADVIIDFSNAKAVDDLLVYSVDKQIPVVLCTTGLSEEQLKRWTRHRKSCRIKICQHVAWNQYVNGTVKTGCNHLAPAGFDMEIVEKHHNQKLDAPSGTALALADSMNEALGNAYTYTYDRSKERKKREKTEIGISAVRGGSIVGEHEVIFAGLDEVIEFKHTAYSRSVFAKGAVQAAKFLSGKPAGFYDMGDVIKATIA